MCKLLDIQSNSTFGLVAFYDSNLVSLISFPALAMALCVAMIAFVRLPSLKVSVLLLFGLLVYDVFWVSIIFSHAF